MTASSYTTTDYSSYRAYNGRLHDTRGDGWCSAVPGSNNDWLQIDFARIIQVCAVASQGDVNGNEWVTDFKLSYSSDGNTWTTYKDANGTDQVTYRYLIVEVPVLWGSIGLRSCQYERSEVQTQRQEGLHFSRIGLLTWPYCWKMPWKLIRPWTNLPASEHVSQNWLHIIASNWSVWCVRKT